MLCLSATNLAETGLTPCQGYSGKCTIVTGSSGSMATLMKTDDPIALLPFRNPALPFEARAKDLVSRLTLDEKVLQLSHADPTDPSRPIDRATSAAIPRLGVGGYGYGQECNSGVIVGYPQNIGMVSTFPCSQAITASGCFRNGFYFQAATFNRSVVFHAGRGTGLGMRARWFDAKSPNASEDLPGYPTLSCWSPMINIMRHPLWGRNHEVNHEYPANSTDWYCCSTEWCNVLPHRATVKIRISVAR